MESVKQDPKSDGKQSLKREEDMAAKQEMQEQSTKGKWRIFF